MVEEIGGKKFVRSPIRTHRDNMADLKEPPGLNEHGRAIMEELGLSDGEIEEIMMERNQKR